MSTITTSAELDALPAESVVIDGKRWLWIRCDSIDEWQCGGAYNRPVSSAYMFAQGFGPFTVLYVPEGVAEPLVSANSRSVANDPIAATPSGLPSVEQIADLLFALYDHGTSPNAKREASAVLALFEAAVPSIKAEASTVTLADEDALRVVLDRMNDAGECPEVAGIDSHGLPFLLSYLDGDGWCEIAIVRPVGESIEWHEDRAENEYPRTCTDAYRLGQIPLFWPITILAAPTDGATTGENA